MMCVLLYCLLRRKMAVCVLSSSCREENSIVDAGVIQVFGSLVNSVIARNRIVRSQGFSILGTAFPWTDGPVNASQGIYGTTQACNASLPASPSNCQWWQVAPAWQIELLNNQVMAGLGYADATNNQLNVIGNQDYGGWPMPNLPGPLARFDVPFGSLSREIVMRGNVLASEGQISAQADRDDGVSAVSVVVEANNVVSRSNAPPGDGPPLQLSGNNSGCVVRKNVCDGSPCGG
jgi:hypothetical protein